MTSPKPSLAIVIRRTLGVFHGPRRRSGKPMESIANPATCASRLLLPTAVEKRPPQPALPCEAREPIRGRLPHMSLEHLPASRGPRDAAKRRHVGERPAPDTVPCRSRTPSIGSAGRVLGSRGRSPGALSKPGRTDR
jgi:hypothetical protein